MVRTADPTPPRTLGLPQPANPLRRYSGDTVARFRPRRPITLRRDEVPQQEDGSGPDTPPRPDPERGMADTRYDIDEARSRIGRVIRYLQELHRVKTPPTVDLEKYEWGLRLDALPDYDSIQRGRVFETIGSR